MADTIAKGAVVLQADGAKLDKDLKAAQSSIMGFATNVGGITFFGSGGMGAGVAAAKGAFDMVGGYVKDYIGGIQEAGNRAEAILNASTAFGIPVQEFQALSNAAKLAGLDIGDFEKGYKELSNVVVGAAMGEDAAAKKLRDLGLSVADFDGKTVTQSFDMVGQAIGKLSSPMERLKAAGDVFGGKSGFKLLPAIGKDFAETMKDVQKYSIDEKQLKALDDAADKWTKLGMAWDAAKLNAKSVIGNSVADALTETMNGVSARGIVNRADKGGFFDYIGSFFDDTVDYEKVAGKIMSIHAAEDALKKGRKDGLDLADAIKKKQDELYAAQLKTTNDVVAATDALAASIGRTPGELDTWKKAQEGIKGELLATIEAENKLQDALRAAAPLVKQSPYVTLQQQLAGLDALLAAGRITQDQFFTATAQAGQSIISQSGVQQQQRQNPEMLVAGTNDAIRQALNDRLDMGAKQTPGELLGSAVEKLNENAAKQVEQGAEMVRQLREIAKTKGGTVEVR